MKLASWATWLGVCLLGFAIAAVGALGCVHLGAMLGAASTAPYAKAVIIAAGVGVVILMLVAWLDYREDRE